MESLLLRCCAIFVVQQNCFLDVLHHVFNLSWLHVLFGRAQQIRLCFYFAQVLITYLNTLLDLRPSNHNNVIYTKTLALHPRLGLNSYKRDIPQKSGYALYIFVRVSSENTFDLVQLIVQFLSCLIFSAAVSCEYRFRVCGTVRSRIVVNYWRVSWVK